MNETTSRRWAAMATHIGSMGDAHRYRILPFQGVIYTTLGFGSDNYRDGIWDLEFVKFT